MDYPCAKFCEFSFSRFRFIVRTDRQTDRQTESNTEAYDRYIRATNVGVSKCIFDYTLQVSSTTTVRFSLIICRFDVSIKV